MTKLTLLALAATLSLEAWAGTPLRGITYGQKDAPSGQEWQSPEAYAHGKEQPHATFYSFASDKNALRVLPEYSEYYQSLDGKWRFHWVGHPDERPQDFFQTGYDDSRWDEVSVPMSWNVYGLQKDGTQKYGTPIYVNQPVIFWHEVKPGDWKGGVMRTPPTNWTTYKHRNEVGSYRRTFTVPQEWDGRQTYIQFEGVDSFFYLWINGKYVGFSKNSRNRAEFDITPYLIKGGTNTLAVEVYRSSDGSFLEAQDMFRLPGIYRSVALVSKPKVQIRDLQVIPSVGESHGALSIKASLTSLDKRAARGYQLSYDLYSLPLYSDLGAEQVATTKSSKLHILHDLESSTTLTLASPRLWSAEAPHRYVLVAKLLDAKGKTIEAVSIYTGFRQVEIKDVPAEQDEFGLAGRYFLINGKPAKLKGVNRHETHPAVGHAITREMMHDEVMLMKRANINHVRNSHYPTHPYFYYLCDKYGIYLEDEANVESHQYYYGEASLSHVPEFDVATTNRMLEMVYANINHPSIVIWSLGNEAGPGFTFVNSYNATKQVDTSRPIQYERNNDIVDMGSNQYPSIPSVQEAVKGKSKIKYPFHISEYAHSMGNAVGGLQDYWTAIESTNFFCGAAIWDWVDQALYHHLPNGQRFIAYGGDFGDTPNDGMFVMNGIIFADRSPKPQYYEVKKVYQNIGITLEGNTLKLFNKQYYTPLEGYRLFASVYEEGKQVSRVELPLPQVAPRSTGSVEVGSILRGGQGGERFLRIDLELKEDMPWAKAGYIQMNEQIFLSPAKLPAIQATGEKLTITAPKRGKEGNITVSNGKVEVVFDTKQGTIHSLRHAGEVVIAEGNGPKLDAFRAACDNDNWAIGNWGKNGLHNLQHKATQTNYYTRADGAVVVSFTVVSQAPNPAKIYDVRASGRYRIEEETDKPMGADDFKFTTAQAFTIYPDGSVELQANITSNNPRLALGRLGYELIIPKRYQQYHYYGRGPINNYSDRKTAQFVEVHKSTVADQFVHFPKPQTMGNREDVRWVTLTDETGRGILFQAGETMSASALPWSAKELLLAPHPHELPEAGDTHLHLDAGVTGLGGNSCGQGPPLAHCRAFASAKLFSFIIRPYDGGEVKRVALSGDVAPAISRSDRGMISISGKEGESFVYSINGGKYQPYTGSFLLRDAAQIQAHKTGDRRLGTSATFERLQSIPLSIHYASSEEASWNPAFNLIDDDPSTIWHTTYYLTVAKYPHWIDFDTNEDETTFRGIVFLQRQGNNRNGRIKDYVIEVSADAQTWTQVHAGAFADSTDKQRVLFAEPAKGRYIRLKAISGHTNTDYASGASFSVIVN